MNEFLCVVGARPNLTKIAPILRAFDSKDPSLAALVHTGQHYDEGLSSSFFHQLGIREPDWNLKVGSASHAVQTARIMERFEPVLEESGARCVVVVGDVNSTIACALVAAKRGVKVAHIESGLRSYDREMPEEINRVLTDQISDWLFTTERSAETNLAKEGIANDSVHFVGNVMIDNLFYSLKNAVPAGQTLAKHQKTDWLQSGYAVVTMHRPANVDEESVLAAYVDTFVRISADLPLFWPLHPRTKAKLEQFGFMQRLTDANILLAEPAGYLELIGLFRDARCVLTDSGGIQEETTALGIPCLTLRENTERPITIDEGTNLLLGKDYEKIISSVTDILSGNGKSGRVPELWDGKAAERIVDILTSR